MSPNQQCQSTQEKSITLHMDLLTPNVTERLSNFVFDHQRLLVTLGEGCHAPPQGNREPLDQHLVPRFFFRNFSKLQNGLFSGICAL